MLSQKRRTSMTISSTEQEAKKVAVVVDKDPVSTSFEKWGQPGHFSRTLAKGPKTTTWIWNLHADAHDFDSHTSSLEDISPWLSNPTAVKPSAQVVWPIVGQEILNGDVGGGFQGVQVTSGFFQIWRAEGWFHYHKAAPKLEWASNSRRTTY
eukprot:1975654-Rhodomonas_salina.1